MEKCQNGVNIGRGIIENIEYMFMLQTDLLNAMQLMIDDGSDDVKYEAFIKVIEIKTMVKMLNIQPRLEPARDRLAQSMEARLEALKYGANDKYYHLLDMKLTEASRLLSEFFVLTSEIRDEYKNDG